MAGSLSPAVMSRNFPSAQARSCAPLITSTAKGAVTISVMSPYHSLRLAASARAPAFGR